MKNKIISSGLLSLFLLCLTLPAKAQSTAVKGNPDWIRSNGLIFIVIAVLLIIFTGLFLYLLILDKKISKLEKQIKHPINE